MELTPGIPATWPREGVEKKRKMSIETAIAQTKSGANSIEYAEGCRNRVHSIDSEIRIAIDHNGNPFPILPTLNEDWMRANCHKEIGENGVSILTFRDGGFRIQIAPSGVTVPEAAIGVYGSNPNYQHRTFRIENYTRAQTFVPYTVAEFCKTAKGNMTI